MKLHGSCHCGAVTFEAEADPEKASICHCTDCQTPQQASVFRTNIPGRGGEFQNADRAGDELHQDHCRQRQSAGAGVLPEMRHADLLDIARR